MKRASLPDCSKSRVKLRTHRFPWVSRAIAPQRSLGKPAGEPTRSTVPLRISTYFGFFVSMVTFFGVILYSIVKVLTHAAWPAGFATLAVLILGSISINAMLLGIIGEYLGRMYMQMKKGPLTIIESSVDAYANSTAPNGR